MIDPNLEIFVGDYISILGDNKFYRVVAIIDPELPDPPKYFDYIIDMNVGSNDELPYKMVSRSIIKGVISNEAMAQRSDTISSGELASGTMA